MQMTLTLCVRVRHHKWQNVFIQRTELKWWVSDRFRANTQSVINVLNVECAVQSRMRTKVAKYFPRNALPPLKIRWLSIEYRANSLQWQSKSIYKILYVMALWLTVFFYPNGEARSRCCGHSGWKSDYRQLGLATCPLSSIVAQRKSRIKART